jgi:hypothetical protein
VPVDTRPIERYNNLAFGAVLIALLLSFVEGNTIALAVELACRAAVIVLVVVAMVRFRRDYFSHWTSWLATLLAVLGATRLLAAFTVG